jgi:hypothetical protein
VAKLDELDVLQETKRTLVEQMAFLRAEAKELWEFLDNNDPERAARYRAMATKLHLAR